MASRTVVLKLPLIATLVAGVLGLPRSSTAQYQTRPWLEWSTIESGRFSVHFPRELEPWARTVAGKLGSVDSVVSRLVGYSPTGRLEVLVDDPFSISNGSAWPLIDEPRLVLWATPPSPREDIGTFVSWADMLAVHEFTHLAHLTRPSRNPFQRLVWKLAPVELGPISRKAPRWLIEGYATYIEGQVTGSGRPNGVWRATILRQWAIEGSLPTYAQLNTMGGMYGGEFAYLAGSSFIEWLTERRGDSSLVALWRRLSARTDRGFSDAFTGVYGESPGILYGRFTAEVTAAAKARELEMRRLGSDTGEVIQHLARETGDPAIARDGGRAAIMLASPDRPARIVIWPTIPEPDTAAERLARTLIARDPEDVAPYRPFPAPKRALATLNAVANQPYQDPRFFTDGRVLVWRNTAVGNGSWMPDLYAWDPQSSTVRRITHQANVRQGDPSPDGKAIAATRCGAGRCDLVMVDPATGAVSVAAAGNDTRSFNRPRFSPSGRAIAAAVHDAGYWRIGVLDQETRSLRIITTGRRNYFDPTFVDDSTLVATAEENGILNIVRLRTDGQVLGRITNVSGAAVAPEVNRADGSVWFLALHARGWDVRASRVQTALPLAAETGGAQPRLVPEAQVPPARSYEPDRRWIYVPGGSFVRRDGSVSLNFVNSDPVGKRELLLQGAVVVGPHSVNSPLEGASITLTERRSMPVVASLFVANQAGPLSQEIAGLSLSTEAATRTETFSRRAMLGGSWGITNTDEDPDRWIGFGELAVSATRYRERHRTTASLGLQMAGGRRSQKNVSRYIATATLASTEVPVTVTAQYGLSRSRSEAEHFVIGGAPSSLVPPGVLSHFVAQPALPPLFEGEHLETYKVSVPFIGARIYGWAGRAYDTGEAAPLERVVGAEWSASIPAIHPLGTPTARATIGVGQWLNHRAATRTKPGGGSVAIAPPGRTQVYFITQLGDWVR